MKEKLQKIRENAIAQIEILTDLQNSTMCVSPFLERKGNSPPY